MGIGDYFLKNNIVYGSDASCEEIKRLLTIIKKSALKESEYLTIDYPELINGRCNSNLLSIAPTGTISLILGCSSGIEPIFNWIYEHRILDGSVQIETNQVFSDRFPDLDNESIEQIKKEGSIQNLSEFSKEEKRVFKTALEISPSDRIKVGAAAQSIVDLSISGTVNIPESSTIEQVKDIYIEAWKKRLKGISIYRNHSKDDQPIQMTCSSGTCDL